MVYNTDKSQWDEHYTPEAIADDLAKRLDIENGDVILDPMCGSGNLLKAVYKLHKDKDVTYIGYDISPEAIEKASELALPNSIFELRAFDDEQETIGNKIIMNPCFKQPILDAAIQWAFKNYSQGIMFIPLEAFNKVYNDLYLDVDKRPEKFEFFMVKKYMPDELKDFDCDIIYEEVSVAWKK